MDTPAALPELALHLRRLLEVVKDACGPEGRWGWLAGPLALLTWFRTRRERREAADAMQAVQGLLEGFLGLLEELRAGRLPECGEPMVQATQEEGTPTPALPCFAGEGANCADGAVAHPSPSRIGPHLCEQKWEPVAGPSPRIKSAGKPALKGRGIVSPTAHVGAGTQWIPAFAGMTGTVRRARMAGAVGFPGMTGTWAIAAWARPPPEGLFQKAA